MQTLCTYGVQSKTACAGKQVPAGGSRDLGGAPERETGRADRGGCQVKELGLRLLEALSPGATSDVEAQGPLACPRGGQRLSLGCSVEPAGDF